jgi:hypothetical protein
MVLRNPKRSVTRRINRAASNSRFSVRKHHEGKEPPGRDGVLDAEYGELQVKLVGRLARKHPSLLERGQLRVWPGGGISSVCISLT